MMTGTNVDLSASLTVFGAPPRRVAVTVVRPSAGAASVRALKGGGVFWAVAAGLCVPSGTSLRARAELSRRSESPLESGTSATRRSCRACMDACPRCGLEQDFAAGNRLTPSWTLDCPACHNNLTLTLDAGEAAGLLRRRGETSGGRRARAVARRRRRRPPDRRRAPARR